MYFLETEIISIQQKIFTLSWNEVNWCCHVALEAYFLFV